MPRKTIKITPDPVADVHAAPNEKIIEFDSPSGGGLISFREADGRLVVDVYRTDPTVDVRSPKPDPFETIATVTRDDDLIRLRAELVDLDNARTVRFVIDGGIKVKVDEGVWTPPLGRVS